MSKKKWIISGCVIVALVAATIVGRQLTGKNSASADSSSESSEKVTTLQVAHNQNYVPYDYINEKGDSDGFEVAVFAGGAENCLEGAEAAEVNAVVLGKGFGDFGEEEAEEAFGFLAVAEELTGERGGGRVQVHFFFIVV